MNMTRNIKINDKINIGYNDIYKLFGEKKFFLMKINMPKGNKFIYLENFKKIGKDFFIGNNLPLTHFLNPETTAYIDEYLFYQQCLQILLSKR